MKGNISYKIHKGKVKKEANYIPFRYIWAGFITLAYIILIIGVVVALCYFVPYFYIVAWITQVAVVIKIFASDDNPDYKITWLLFVLVLPIVGFMLYFLFYSRKVHKKYVKRLKELKKREYIKDDSKEFSELKKEDLCAFSQVKMLCSLSESHLFKNTAVEYFSSGEEIYKRMLIDLNSAERFIFMEYFIIEEGVFWDSVLKILKTKAENGLDVRIVYDDIGCMRTLSGNYYKKLNQLGIKATPFSRLKGRVDSEFNNRNHRKITVVDGYIGYTGGINIADEYINRVERFGHWKDSGLRLEGEGVWELTKLFLTDYGINLINPKDPDGNFYPSCEEKEARGFIVPFGDGPRPVYEYNVGKCVIKNMLASANEYAYISTPYLIIDNDTCQSIESAAMRGVDVRIILPHVPDKKIVFEMGKSFYARLQKVGVKIYEYESGFIHAKNYLVDDKYAMVGSINLDYRSLVHHFEDGVFMCRTECIGQIKADMESVIEKSILITEEMIKARLYKRVFRSIVRIFAPLL